MTNDEKQAIASAVEALAKAAPDNGISILVWAGGNGSARAIVDGCAIVSRFDDPEDAARAVEDVCRRASMRVG